MAAVGEMREYGGRVKSSNIGSRDVFLAGFIRSGCSWRGLHHSYCFLWIVPCYDRRWRLL